MKEKGISALAVVATIVAAVAVGAGVYLIVTKQAAPGGPQGGGPSENRGPYATFLCIHLEPGGATPGGVSWQEYYWPYVMQIVALADNYNAKLTLHMSPQYAEYVLQDAARINIVRGWQKNGHEIGLHHHLPKHQGVWDGYTDNVELVGKKIKNVEYRGSLENMMALVREVAAPESVLSASVGPLEEYQDIDSPTFTEWPLGIRYHAFGVIDGSVSRPVENIIRGSRVKVVLHHYLYFGSSPQQPLGQLPAVQSQFLGAKSDEIVGVNLHDLDYPKDSGAIMRSWLEFLKGKNCSVRTLSDILSRYPA